MLKTGVSSQLEGVRTGLAQLEEALEDIKSVRRNLVDIEDCLAYVSPLKDKLRRLKDESRKRSQYFAAMENLQHIFEVPETLEKTRELIRDGQLLHAHKNIMDLEGARDDLLLEMHRQKLSDRHETKLLEAYFSEVAAVSKELGKQLWYILQRTLDTVRGQPAKIVTPLRIIEREERIDAMCRERQKATGFMPPNRPREWKKKCLEILEEVVVNRIEGTQLEDKSDHKQWLVRYLEMCRQRVLEDLKIVMSLCDPIFPPRYNIRQSYIQMYHSAVSNRLQEIAREDLDKNELIHLLSWVKSYHSSEMLSESNLVLDVGELAAAQPLLPRSIMSSLLSRFLRFVESDMASWLNKALEGEEKDWKAPEEPEKDSIGIYISTLPSTLFQIIEGQIVLASQISDDATLRVMNLCVEHMIDFANRFRDLCQTYHSKYMKQREESVDPSQSTPYYTGKMISNANTCLICAESCDQLRSDAKTRGSTCEMTQRQALLNKIEQLKELWQNNLNVCISNLIEEINFDFKPHLLTILTKQWFIEPNQALTTVLLTLADYCKDYVHAKPVLIVRLLEKIQMKILAEYLKAVESRRMVFSTYDERYRAGGQLKKEADHLKKALQDYVPKGYELDVLVDILSAMAEVLTLRDHSLLALEVSSFVQKFPDVTPEQLSGLLSLREDTSVSDAKTQAAEILNQHRFRSNQQSPYQPLFVMAKADMPKKGLVGGFISSAVVG